MRLSKYFPNLFSAGNRDRNASHSADINANSKKQGRTVTQSDVEIKVLSRQNSGINKELFDKKITILKQAKIFLRKQWIRVQGFVRPNQSVFEPEIYLELKSTNFKNSLKSQKTGCQRAKHFLKQHDYIANKKNFTHELKKFSDEYNIFKGDNSLRVLKVILGPDTTNSDRAITDLDTVKSNLQQHGIKVTETNGQELTIKLGDKHISNFKDSDLYMAYRHLLIFAALKTLIQTKKADPEIMDDPVAVVKFDNILNQLDVLADQAMGLCHALLKDEMPGFFQDDLYTPLCISDKNGVFILRSDGIQPRGGWLDSRT